MGQAANPAVPDKRLTPLAQALREPADGSPNLGSRDFPAAPLPSTLAKAGRGCRLRTSRIRPRPRWVAIKSGRTMQSPSRKIQYVPCAARTARLRISSRAEALIIMPDVLKIVPARGLPAIDECRRGRARTVVGHDDLERRIALSLKRTQHRIERIFAVVGRNDDGNQLGHGSPSATGLAEVAHADKPLGTAHASMLPCAAAQTASQAPPAHAKDISLYPHL